jgi:hypothetical protein
VLGAVLVGHADEGHRTCIGRLQPERESVGLADGDVTITASGSAATPYQYSIDGGTT